MSNISFKTKLTSLINQYSKENESNTPDFILANYISNSLNAFTEAVQQRETWYGRDSRPSVTDNKANVADNNQAVTKPFPFIACGKMHPTKTKQDGCCR